MKRGREKRFLPSFYRETPTRRALYERGEEKFRQTSVRKTGVSAVDFPHSFFKFRTTFQEMRERVLILPGSGHLPAMVLSVCGAPPLWGIVEERKSGR